MFFFSSNLAKQQHKYKLKMYMNKDLYNKETHNNKSYKNLQQLKLYQKCKHLTYIGLPRRAGVIIPNATPRYGG